MAPAVRAAGAFVPDEAKLSEVAVSNKSLNTCSTIVHAQVSKTLQLALTPFDAPPQEDIPILYLHTTE